MVDVLEAGDGWLIVDAVPGWVWIRIYKDGRIQDRSATWVEQSRVAKLSYYNYPDSLIIPMGYNGDPNKPFDDWLYPEMYD